LNIHAHHLEEKAHLKKRRDQYWGIFNVPEDKIESVFPYSFRFYPMFWRGAYEPRDTHKKRLKNASSKYVRRLVRIQIRSGNELTHCSQRNGYKRLVDEWAYD